MYVAEVHVVHARGTIPRLWCFTFVKFCERRRNATLGIVPKADVQLMQVKTACGQRA